MIFNMISGGGGDTNVVIIASSDESKGIVGGITKFVYTKKAVAQTFSLSSSTFNPTTGYIFSTLTASVGSIAKVDDEWILTVPANTEGEITITAEFAVAYKITVQSNDTSKGAVSGVTIYYFPVGIETQIDLTATVFTFASGYCFDKYTTPVGTISGNNSKVITIPSTATSDFIVTANFIQDQFFRLTPESGSISVRPIFWDGTSTQYSDDEGHTWNNWTDNLTVYSNTYIMFRATGAIRASSTGSSYGSWNITGTRVTCSGNIETVLDYTVVDAGNHPTMGEKCYDHMFYGAPIIVPPVLPAVTLTKHCYRGMFIFSHITTAPALNVMTLAEGCYDQMFFGCDYLATAPALPATTLAKDCYSDMFGFNGILATAPVLPATALVEGCYKEMFRYCNNINYIEVGFDTWLAGATDDWVVNVASTGTFKCPAALPETVGDSNIPTGWTIQKPTFNVTVSSADTSKGTVSGTTVFAYTPSTSDQTVTLTTTFNPASGYEIDVLTPSVGSIAKVGSDYVLTIPANTATAISVVTSWKVAGATVNVNLKRDGVAQAGEIVSASCTGQTTQTKTTDASGNCTFTGLPNGTWTFSTSNASYVCDSVSQACVAGQTYNINLTQSTVALKVNVKKFGVAEANATVVLKQGSTTIGTKTTDASGDCQFGSLSPSTAYTVEATCVTTPVFSTSTSVTTGASGLTTLNLGLGNRVGGRIFYVDTTSTGGTYTFYKQDGSQITTSATPTVAELADAYYYSVSGTPSKDMFYVYDNTNGLITSKEWGARGTSVGVTSDGIGVGKTNSATCLANSACFTPYTSGNTTIWKWLRDEINANNIGGCNDWFIASKAEQDKLRASGIVTWYSSNYIWSSVEYDGTGAWRWSYGYSDWYGRNKFDTRCVFASRAF